MPAYYWIVSYGGPTFLKHVHDAAIKWQKNVFPKMKQLFEATQPNAPGVSQSPDTAKAEEEPDQETSIAEKVLTKLAKIKEETLSIIAESKTNETKDEATQTDEVTSPSSTEKFLKNIFDAIQKWGENVASKIEKITDPFHPERQVVEEHQSTKVNQSPKEESTPTTVMSQEKVQPAEFQIKEKLVQSKEEPSKAPQSTLKSMKKESGVVVQHSPLEVVKPKLVEESEKKAKEENKENQKL